MNVKVVLSYKGTNYCGWQVQPGLPTVCGTLQDSLSKVFNQSIRVIGASRTDSRVHAKGQVANFRVVGDLELGFLKLNSLLPSDIRIISYDVVDDEFNAQHAAQFKEYRYFIDNNLIENVFTSEFAYHYRGDIDLDLLKWAMSKFVGTHDFRSFQNSGSSVKTTTRTILSTDVFYWYHLLVVVVVGNGFLKQMVRNMVGAALMHASKRITKDEFLGLIEPKEKMFTVKCLPGKGLFLWEITY